MALDYKRWRFTARNQPKAPVDEGVSAILPGSDRYIFAAPAFNVHCHWIFG
jgi:hypothetical protein